MEMINFRALDHYSCSLVPSPIPTVHLGDEIRGKNALRTMHNARYRNPAKPGRELSPTESFTKSVAAAGVLSTVSRYSGLPKDEELRFLTPGVSFMRVSKRQFPDSDQMPVG